MDKITVKGTEYPIREFKVKELEHTLTVAPYSLYENIEVGDPVDDLIYFYVEDEHFGKPALELCESYLDEPFTLINEII